MLLANRGSTVDFHVSYMIALNRVCCLDKKSIMVQRDFRKGRETTDGMFSLRQLVEKRLERQGNVDLEFVHLEKAFVTVPRKTVMTILRWTGASEAEIRMGEAMYKNTKGRGVVGSGMSNEFHGM